MGLKKLTCALWAKLLAFILLCIFVPATALCGIGAAYAVDQGWYYEDKTATFAESGICRNTMSDDMNRVMSALENGYLQDSDEADFYTSSSFAYIVSDDKGEILFDSTTERSVLCQEGWECGTPKLSNSKTDAVSGTDTVFYTIDGYLNYPLSEEYLFAEQAFHALYDHVQLYIPLACILAALSILLFVFLMIASGRKGESGEIVLSGLNRVPLDLYLLLAVAASCTAVALGSDFYFNVDWVILLLITAGLLLGTVILLAVCMTLAARFKAGKWWRNTVVFCVCRGLWKLCCSLMRALPLVWKALLIYLAFMFPVVVCASMSSGLVLIALLLILLGAAALVFFSLQLRSLAKAGDALAAGDLQYTVDTSKMFWEIKKHGDNLNSISAGINHAVGERIKSERLKTELITNVSHDIKTPLTSIINYIDLLKKEDLQNETAAEYIETLDRQSMRLKKLTEDVVEASKASTGNMPVSLLKTDVSELLEQIEGEYVERLAAAGLSLVVGKSKAENARIMGDGRHMSRIFDNLISNACKYSQEGTRVYLDAIEKGGNIEISLKNISRDVLNIGADELMERFVRGDSSRSSEGSGLGLSIAQSLTELQGGSFRLQIDGDLFKAILSFPAL